MRSLFLKIFLWFSLTVVVIGSILVIITVITRSSSEEAEWQNGALFAGEAVRAVDIYEREGAAALTKHLEDLPKTPMHAYLVDEHGTEVLGQKLPEQLARKQFDDSPPPRFLSDHFPMPGGMGARAQVMAKPVVGASGRRYTAILVIPPMSPRSFLAWLGYVSVLRLGAVLVIAGIFCFWLARHITAPVVRLRQAANKIAVGDFSARASTRMSRRQDEIGMLAHQFDRMAERIESLLADHERLLSTVSHELRSPLTRLSVAAALLRQCPEEEKLEYLNRIELETEQLNKLIAQLLTLSRIESGVDAIAQKETIDLANLLHEVAADGNFEAQSRSCRVSVGAVDPCVTTGILEQIRRAIENVVRNAIRHTKANTEVEITMRQEGTPPNGTAIVRVRDHGPGVPDSDLEKIFQPFYRVTSPDGSNSNSSGLGLAITERIARSHGGAVRAVNAPDGGLLVELELPVNK